MTFLTKTSLKKHIWDSDSLVSKKERLITSHHDIRVGVKTALQSAHQEPQHDTQNDTDGQMKPQKPVPCTGFFFSHKGKGAGKSVA